MPIDNKDGGETKPQRKEVSRDLVLKAETAAAYPFSMQSHSKTLKVRLIIGIFKKRSKFGKSGNGGNRYEKRSVYRQSGAGCQPCIYTRHKCIRAGRKLKVFRLKTSYSKSSLDFFIPSSRMVSRYIIKRQNHILFRYF